MGSAQAPCSPLFATANVTASEFRLGLGGFVESSPTANLVAEAGVVPAHQTPFELTSVGTGSAPAWSVGTGRAVVARPTGGTYMGTWDQPQTIAVERPLPAAGQTRRDRVVGRIIDTEADSGATDPTLAFQVETVTGSASSSPSAPQLPPGTLPIWQYTVAANGTLSNVERDHTWTRAIGGTRLVETGDTRPGSRPGDLRIFRSGQIDCWLLVGTTWSWVTIVSAPAWTQANASLYATGSGMSGEFGLGTGGYKIMRWKRVGNDLHVSYAFRWGDPPYSTPGGNVISFLPNGWVGVARDQWIPCHLWVNDLSNSRVQLDFFGMAHIAQGTNQVRFFFPRSNGSGGYATGALPYRVATGQGPGSSIPFIAGGYASGGRLHAGGVIEVAS